MKLQTSRKFVSSSISTPTFQPGHTRRTAVPSLFQIPSLTQASGAPSIIDTKLLDLHSRTQLNVKHVRVKMADWKCCIKLQRRPCLWYVRGSRECKMTGICAKMQPQFATAKRSLLTFSLRTLRWNLNYAQIIISPFEPSPEWLRCGYKINTTIAVYCGGNHTKSDKSWL